MAPSHVHQREKNRPNPLVISRELKDTMDLFMPQACNMDRGNEYCFTVPGHGSSCINLRNAKDYYLPQPRTETFKKSTYYSIPAAWNDLIPEIKLQDNKVTFKWTLKAHLLDLIDTEKQNYYAAVSIGPAAHPFMPPPPCDCSAGPPTGCHTKPCHTSPRMHILHMIC